MVKKIIFNILLCFFMMAEMFCNSSPCSAQLSKVSALQQKIKKAAEKACSSSVFLGEVDPVTKRIRNRFSGVVINEDGFILTAAHATIPDKFYLVSFPDGKVCYAKSLGRIPSADPALLRIINPGKWPYSPMGRSSLLYKGEPCFSISYPGGLPYKDEPVVKFGYVEDVENTTEEPGEIFLRTTCLMEPGDSGGPIFDLDGNVIGIESRIGMSESDNYEVPADVFRKYRTALLEPKTYSEKPNADSVNTTIKRTYTDTVICPIDYCFTKTEQNLQPFCVKVYSQIDGNTLSATAAVFSLNEVLPQKNTKKYGYIITKSSLVGDNPTVLQNGQIVEATIVDRDTADDLALLQVHARFEKGITDKGSYKDSVVDTLKGSFLISPQPENASDKISVLGSKAFELPRLMSGGQIGMTVQAMNDTLYVQSIIPGAAAESGGLAKDDRILKVDNKHFAKPDDMMNEVVKYNPGDTLSFEILRNGTDYQKKVVLSGRATEMHVANFFAGGKSSRLDGFPLIFIHDALLNPEECGGPVFDINGKFMGINIARYSRTMSLTIPAIRVWRFIKGAVKKTG